MAVLTAELRNDETALVRRVAIGDDDAMRELVATYGSMLLAFVRRRVGASVEDAEEIVQDAFVSAVEAARDFRGECSLKTWLCGIAKIRTVDYMRAKGRAKRIPADKLVRLDEPSLQAIRAVYDPEVSLDDLVDQLDRVRLVQSLLDSLSPDQREALVLHHIEGFSVPETARIMERSQKAVEKLLERAKEKPRQEVMRWLGEESFRMVCLGLVML